VLLGVALSLVVWSAAPDAPPSPTAIAMVFESPAAQPEAAAPQPEVAAETASQPEPPPQQEMAIVPQPEESPPQAVSVPLPDPPAAPPPAPPSVLQSEPPRPEVRPKPRQFVTRTPVVTKSAPAKPGSAPPGEAVASAREVTPPTTQSVSPVAAGWNSLFAAWLAERKRYPETARRHGEQGNVTLRFKVAGDGRVVDVALIEGSGSSALDEAAEALLRDAKMPAPLTEISRTVRVRYRLDD
jgi:protein TonB